MENTNAFDVLLQNLKKRGLQAKEQTSERSFVIPGGDRMLKMRSVSAPVDKLWFCAYDSYSTSAQSSVTRTGIYSAILLPAEAECHVYRKDWVDHFLRFRKHKTGSSYIDENLTITSASGWTPSSLITDKEVMLFLALNDIINPLKMIFQHDYLPVIDDLKGKMLVGIESDLWIYEDNDLDAMLNLGGQLIQNITKHSQR